MSKNHPRLEQAIVDVIPKRLLAYGWGTSSGDATYTISDIRGLYMAAGNLRYILKETGARLYYRGQVQHYETGIVPSLYRRVETEEKRRERDGKVQRAIALVKSGANWDPKGSAEQSEALAQHYGLRTRWVDVVDHLQTAAWFAYHSPTGTSDDAGIGNIYLIALEKESVHSAADLRERGSNWIRPHIQQGFEIATNAQHPDLNECVVARFILPRTLLRSASGYDFYTERTFFPPRGEDQGRFYWIKAAEVLRRELSSEDFDLLIWSDGN